MNTNKRAEYASSHGRCDETKDEASNSYESEASNSYEFKAEDPYESEDWYRKVVIPTTPRLKALYHENLMSSESSWPSYRQQVDRLREQGGVRGEAGREEFDFYVETFDDKVTDSSLIRRGEKRRVKILVSDVVNKVLLVREVPGILDDNGQVWVQDKWFEVTEGNMIGMLEVVPAEPESFKKMVEESGFTESQFEEEVAEAEELRTLGVWFLMGDVQEIDWKEIYGPYGKVEVFWFVLEALLPPRYAMHTTTCDLYRIEGKWFIKDTEISW